MVKGQHLVEEEQAGVWDAQLVFGQRGKPLDLAHRVVGEEAHSPGSKRRQRGQPRRFMPAQRPSQHGKDVILDLDDLFAFGDGDLAPTRHNALERCQPDEGVAAYLLAVFHRLQQEALRLGPGRA